MFIVLCADDYAGEWNHSDEDEAVQHAAKLDPTCSCGGPHTVIESDRIDDV